MESTTLPNSFEKISPTAWGIAYRRSDCDIPFAREIMDELGKSMSPAEKSKMIDLVGEKGQALTPQFEARYKLLNRLLERTGIKQVLELASGMSPRGLEISRDPQVSYVELDLPGIIKQKINILDSLAQQGKIIKSENLKLVSGNALDDLSSVGNNFKPNMPLAIVHEGLLRYLSFEDKSKVVANIKQLLEKFGGVYITPDITLRVFIDEHVKSAVSSIVGIDINANVFENVEQAEKFFSDFGFSIEKHSFMEIKDELVSPGRLGLSEREVIRVLKDPVFFVMRLHK